MGSPGRLSLHIPSVGRQPTERCGGGHERESILFVPLGWLDLATRTIPNAIVYPALVLAAALSPSGPGLEQSLGGGLGALAAWSAIRELSRGGRRRREDVRARRRRRRAPRPAHVSTVCAAHAARRGGAADAKPCSSAPDPGDPLDARVPFRS